MTPAARLAAAVELLDAIGAAPTPAEQHVSAYFRARRYAGSKDRRWVTEFVYRALRRQGELDAVALEIGLEPSPRLRCLLSLILFEDVVPDALGTGWFGGPHGLDELTATEEAALANAAGVDLASLPLAARGNFPDWLADKITAQYGEMAEAVMQAYGDRAPVTLRVNAQKGNRSDIQYFLKNEGIDVTPTQFSPDGLIMTVVDFCAGSGGKSLAMAAQMDYAGKIYAFDVEERRMRDIGIRAKRAGVSLIEPLAINGDDRDDQLFAPLVGRMDRVFVDAPCSGSGTWRRQPDMKWKLTEERLAELVALQADILARAEPLVAPGGRLIYATCSILKEENEAQIEAFLSSHPEFSLCPVGDIWDARRTSGPTVFSPPCWNARLSKDAKGTLTIS